MRIFIFIFLSAFCFGQQHRMLVLPPDKNMALPAKAFGPVVQYLDGTINSANEFVDKSGNGFNADIINRDFNVNYFPYKSAAMIAQKAANFGKIPDPTNFWYTSGGTPNQIPVVSLFQNIDYADQIFTKHGAQLINGDSTEYQEPAVIEIVSYSVALTGTGKTNAYAYFGVPTEVTGNVIWVDPVNGNNANTGTKASKFKTLEKANTSTSGKTIYVMSGAVTVIASIFFLNSQSWKFIGFSPITSTVTPVLSTSGSNSTTCEGAVVTAASGGRAFYFISGNNDTLRRCKAIANGSGSKCFQTLDGTSNAIINSVLISSQDQAMIDIRKVGITLYGNNLSGSPTVEPISYNTTALATGARIYYNRFAQTLAANKSLFLFNIAGNYYIKFNTIRTDGGAQLQALLSGSTMTGTVHWKYNDIQSTNLTSGVIVFSNLTNTITTNISNNKIVIKNGSIANGAISVLNQPAMTINNNFIDLYVVGTGINISSTSAKGAADISYNTILARADGGHIVLGSDANNTYDNGYNGSTITGNKLYGIWYFNPGSVTNASHGIAVFNSIDVKVKYNYCNGTNHLVVYKASDRGTAMANTDAICQYNIGINNEASLFAKTMSGIRFYNNTCYSDNSNIVNIAGGVYLLGSTGAATSCTVQNNIFIDGTPTNTNISVFRADPIGSLTGLASNNNVMYSINNNSAAKVVGTSTVTSYSFAQWQAAGYDASTLNQNVNFTSGPNEQWWPSSSILNGANLGATYQSGLDITSKYGFVPPLIITKSQSGAWQNGAYVQ